MLTGTYVVTQADAAAGQIVNKATVQSTQVSTLVTDTETTPIKPNPKPPQPIPTLSEWGLLLMSFIMLGLAGRRMRQRGLRS